MQDCLNRFHQQRFLPYNGIVSVTNDIDDSLVGITEGEIPTLIFEEESIRMYKDNWKLRIPLSWNSGKSGYVGYGISKTWFVMTKQRF